MRIATPLLALLITACATAGGTGSSRDPSVLTQEEIVEANQLNVLDLIRSDRPHWLRIRGSTSLTQEPEIRVYLDGVHAGGVEMLADIATINVEEIHYYDARQAQYRFGVGHVQGAIEVITKRD
ncbi:MAG: hypothetical protein GWM90_19985 [Gemmatimonadetes bacterium]|nr:hypothetical protein [Gemmatimonadota bacterium]NIQ56720.1 hypothetical protein [Gemmatimonadota bacterium]NIU76906.1 hypothetical protein [Gammaproteobacteria bacterium]NIX46281.1 hypothetical protein [Gemmatimonadota bacterium]NIY10602.1 hypothetical protein [Gemmatimonadota bacterium]